MNKSLKQLFTEGKLLTLSKDERSDIRNILKAFIATTDPVRMPLHGRLYFKRSMLDLIKLTFTKPMPILIAILVVLGGSASFAAQNTLPGDVLYPIKVSVNERVQGAVFISPEAKIRWEANLADRRLDEAEELAAEGKLDADARAHIEANFQEHADKVAAHIEAFADKDSGMAAEAASNFEASLKAHERILINIGEAKNAGTEVEARSIIILVNKERNDTAEVKADAEAKTSAGANTEAAAKGRMNAAENQIAEVEKFLELKKDGFDTNSVAQAEARLNLAKDLVAQGVAQLNAKAFDQAFMLFARAHFTAQEAKLLLEAKVQHQIQIDLGL